MSYGFISKPERNESDDLRQHQRISILYRYLNLTLTVILISAFEKPPMSCTSEWISSSCKVLGSLPIQFRRISWRLIASGRSDFIITRFKGESGNDIIRSGEE